MIRPWPLFILFMSLSYFNDKTNSISIKEKVKVVLSWGNKMVGPDESTRLLLKIIFIIARIF